MTDTPNPDPNPESESTSETNPRTDSSDSPDADTATDSQSDVEESATVAADGIRVEEPEHQGTVFEFDVESVPDRLSPCLDFFHDRPALYLYEYNQEEPEFGFLLPTMDDPHLQVLKKGEWENDALYEKLRED